jgi:hypothetical protein
MSSSSFFSSAFFFGEDLAGEFFLFSVLIAASVCFPAEKKLEIPPFFALALGATSVLAGGFSFVCSAAGSLFLLCFLGSALALVLVSTLTFGSSSILSFESCFLKKD